MTIDRHSLFKAFVSSKFIGFLCGIAALCTVFPCILEGRLLHNGAYIYSFEPWYHHRGALDSARDLANPILSDSVDGANANLSPLLSLPSVSRHIVFANAFPSILEFFVSRPAALSTLYLTCQLLMLFCLWGYLTSIGVPRFGALAISIGFTFGATNNHYYGWAIETCLAVCSLYFLEKLLKDQKPIDFALLTYSLMSLAGREMVHVIFLYAIFIFLYSVTRVSTLPSEIRGKVAKMVFLSMAFSVLVSIDSLYPTVYYYLVEFEKGYRSGFGASQLWPDTLLTLFFSRPYGNPIGEAQRWPSTFVNCSMFIGTVSVFSLCLWISPQVIKRNLNALGILMILFCAFGLTYQYKWSFERIEVLLAAVPPFTWIRPEYFKSIFHLILAILSGLSLRAVSQGALSSKFEKIFGSLLIVGAFWLANSLFSDAYDIRGPSEWALNFYQSSLPLMAISAAGLITYIWVPFIRNIILILLCASSAIEARVQTSGWFPSISPSLNYPKTAVTSYLKRNGEDSRIISLGFSAVPSVISRETYGIEMAAGRMPVTEGLRILLQQADPNAYSQHPTQYLFSESVTNLSHPVWDLLNVGHVVASRRFSREGLPSKNLKVHNLKDGVIIERVPQPKGMVFRTNGIIADSPQDMLEKLKNLDWSKDVILDRPLTLSPGSPETSGQVLSYSRKPNIITAEVNQFVDGVWVVSEKWLPGWNIVVDGGKREALKAFQSLLAVKTPPGKHKIEISYEIPGLNYAFVFSLISALGMVSYIVSLVRVSR